MSLGRRKIALSDRSAWVFNRAADVYDARPPYPSALVDTLTELAGPRPSRVVDLGAGTGHLALPLAERGFSVTAVEPAEAMLERLRAKATARGLELHALHATAEHVPVDAHEFELAIVADALHFLDAELTGREVRRLLVRGGCFALITCELSRTPYMQRVVRLMEESAPRRPRNTARLMAQVAAVARVTLSEELIFHDRTTIEHETLDLILRSISYIGPAMNQERFAAFRARVHAIEEAPVWARTFKLRFGRTRS